MKLQRIWIPVYSFLFFAMACSGNSGTEKTAVDSLSANADSPSVQELTADERSEGWELLFDGQDLSHWRSIKNENFPSEGWGIEEGALVLDGEGGDIITREKYGDFELTWDFKLTHEANSGIKYFVDSINHHETGKAVINGPEYQIIDDLNHEGIKDDPNGLSSTGSLYLIYAPENKTLNPEGEWNHARIISKDKHVEHWLNGKKVVEYEKGSADFLKRMNETKFKDYPNYGQVPEGHILITDHHDRVFFKNMRIRRL